MVCIIILAILTIPFLKVLVEVMVCISYVFKDFTEKVILLIFWNAN